MASKSAQIEHLRNVPLFAGCSSKELQAVHRAGDEITMADGTVIIDQGQLGREAFVILEGKVGVKRSDRKIATLGPGDVVGELALLDHGPAPPARRAKVTAPCSCSTNGTSAASSRITRRSP